jgi:hypothetical protein
VAGYTFYTTTTGLSSTFNSSLGPPAKLTAGGNSYWNGSVYFPDIMRNPFNMSVSCIVNSTGTQTYNVEHTFDNTTLPTFLTSAANWFPNSGITAATSSVTGNYAYPVRAIRLNVTAGASQGTVQMTLIQA